MFNGGSLTPTRKKNYRQAALCGRLACGGVLDVWAPLRDAGMCYIE